MKNHKKAKLVLLFTCAIIIMGHSQNLRVELLGGLKKGELLYVDNYLEVTNKNELGVEYISSEVRFKCIYAMANHLYVGVSADYSSLKTDRTLEYIRFLDNYNNYSEIRFMTMSKDRFTSTLLVGYEIPKTPVFFEVGGASILHYNHQLEGHKVNQLNTEEYQSRRSYAPIISQINLEDVDYGSSNSFGLSFGGGVRFNFGNIGIIASYTTLIEQASTPGIKTNFKTKFSNHSYNLGLSYSFTREDSSEFSDKIDSTDLTRLIK